MNSDPRVQYYYSVIFFVLLLRNNYNSLGFREDTLCEAGALKKLPPSEKYSMDDRHGIR